MMTTHAGARWTMLAVVLLPLWATAQPAPREGCEALLHRRYACQRDSDCTAVTAGCGDLAVSKAGASAATIEAASCKGMLCPAVVSPPGIPLCLAARCTMRLASSIEASPLDLCLRRHVEQFPRDKARVSVKVSPLPGGGVSAVAAGDAREVARCLEDVLMRLASAKAEATLEFSPDVPVPGLQLQVSPSAYQQTRPSGIRTQRVEPKPGAPND